MENKGDSGPSDTKQNNSPNAEIDTAFVIPEGKRANSDSQHASKVEEFISNFDLFDSRSTISS